MSDHFANDCSDNQEWAIINKAALTWQKMPSLLIIQLAGENWQNWSDVRDCHLYTRKNVVIVTDQQRVGQWAWNWRSAIVESKCKNHRVTDYLASSVRLLVVGLSNWNNLITASGNLAKFTWCKKLWVTCVESCKSVAGLRFRIVLNCEGSWKRTFMGDG